MKAEIARFRAGFPVRYFNGEKNEDSTGNFINDCKNSRYCFDCFELEDCKYSSQLFMSRDCQDIFTWGRPGELLYYCTATGDHAYRNAFCVSCANGKELLYDIQCMNSEHLFGCAGLRKNSCCVLNRQYSKEDYQRLVPKIIAHMRQTGEWGEFFPAHLSHFGYNESIAQDYEPITKDEALQRGCNWCDYSAPLPQTKKTLLASELPDDISSAPADILDSAIVCEASGRPFRLIQQELRFLQANQIPLPRRHPNVRYQDRLALRNPRKLFARSCNRCSKPLQTSYAPDRPEKILCEQCYLEEVY
jgi:hypothetical protein